MRSARSGSCVSFAITGGSCSSRPRRNVRASVASGIGQYFVRNYCAGERPRPGVSPGGSPCGLETLEALQRRRRGDTRLAGRRNSAARKPAKPGHANSHCDEHHNRGNERQVRKQRQGAARKPCEGKADDRDNRSAATHHCAPTGRNAEHACQRARYTAGVSESCRGSGDARQTSAVEYECEIKPQEDRQKQEPQEVADRHSESPVDAAEGTIGRKPKKCEVGNKFQFLLY